MLSLGAISADTFGAGAGGNIAVNAPAMVLQGKGVIEAETGSNTESAAERASVADAGNIVLGATDITP